MVLPPNHAYTALIKAFKADCDNLLEQFKEKDSEDFKVFIPLWKSLKFNLVYEKYSRNGLQYDFKEDSLQIAKTIMLNDHFVGGMFLLYSLYYVQENPRPYIRLEFPEFQRLLKFIKDERSTLLGTCQPGYMFAKLLKNNAFAFVKFARDFSLEGQNRARLIHSNQPTSALEHKRINAKTWLSNFLEKVELKEELKEVDNEYLEKKQKLKEEHPDLNLTLDLACDDIISGLENSLTQTDSVLMPAKVNIGLKRQRLKHRERKIRNRYAMPVIAGKISKPEPLKNKMRGAAQREKRTLGLKQMINEPPTESEESSSGDDIKLSLPDI